MKTITAQPDEASPFAARESELAAAAHAAVERGHWSRLRLLTVLLGLLVLGGAAVAAVVLVGGGASGVTVVPNSLAVIDPVAQRVVDDVRLPGDSPGPVEAAGQKVWLLNRDSSTATSVNAKTREPSTTFSVGQASPSSLAVDGSGIWVAGAESADVTFYSPEPAIEESVKVAEDDYFLGPGANIIRDGETLWATSSTPSFIARINGGFTPSLVKRIPLKHSPSALAAGGGYVWIGGTDGTVSRLDPVTNEVRSVSVGDRPEDIAVGNDAVWIGTDAGEVIKLDEGSLAVTGSAKVADPISLAVGQNAVWVASTSGTVSRIDPAMDTVVKTIRVGDRPQGIAFGGGLVWVTVRR